MLQCCFMLLSLCLLYVFLLQQQRSHVREFNVLSKGGVLFQGNNLALHHSSKMQWWATCRWYRVQTLMESNLGALFCGVSVVPVWEISVSLHFLLMQLLRCCSGQSHFYPPLNNNSAKNKKGSQENVNKITTYNQFIIIEHSILNSRWMMALHNRMKLLFAQHMLLPTPPE